MTSEQKIGRRKAIAKAVQRQRMTAISRAYWAKQRRQQAMDGEEPRDTTIETAGNPDYELRELPDLVVG